ncbi:ATG29 (YPL166W) [Zygosaccharomyces parabailii]|uniref:Autophagy-related protein 29 n=1 Tax=Zygosaccharomyces bailii (strain CLIB 213 / ATCC 58445 / CBS 680 / BCRC 21525 / NBRC 1098 / NCYC 1416 / NRRL Y-2227) TaxID=1333698 RepID=A0A8J2XAA3_ZYGB2|nr:ATG29 (YPL166W) [Zygosaccharomyces parabailii]CDF91069.1 ZYBA0S09-04104g1_1 [Zygosaccharomyces bailii CLIB 213]CDH14093.1 related to Autophagy-related protein 29 [Zygosaccharomyces bailii ISA1307]SJM86239.1 related to Autophagy-related protein 29 [Zygosaccharomyces bailii]
MDNTNTIVYVKVKGKRPDGFTDLPKFEWNIDKERQLWAIVSKLENYQDQIDWEGLSDSLGAPDYFLKKRSYKLFTKHLGLLEQQIERKINTGDDSKPSEKANQLGPTPENDVIDEGYHLSEETADAEKLEKTTMKTLQHLHTSRILSRPRLPSGVAKETRNGSQTQANSDSESSSSLSVSSSALEEALMDRLKL